VAETETLKEHWFSLVFIYPGRKSIAGDSARNEAKGENRPNSCL